MQGMGGSRRPWIWVLLGAAVALPVVVYGLQASLSRRPTPPVQTRAPTPLPTQMVYGFPAPMTYWQACYLEASVCNPNDPALPDPQTKLPAALLRPLRLPVLHANAGCPTAAEVEVTTSAFGGLALGSGPVRLLSSAVVPIARDPSMPAWYSPNATTIWFSEPSYQGPWIVRGRQLDGVSPVIFGNPPALTASLVVPPIPTINTTDGNRSVPTSFLVQQPGCYAVQVDGLNFSYDIVFQTVVASATQPPSCSAGQLQLSGIFNDCAVNAPNLTQYCTVSGSTLDDVLTLRGTTHQYLLYLSIDGAYRGAGDYYLAPWSSGSGLGVNDGKAKVAVREYQTGAFWQSVSGTLHVSGNDGRSGDVAVNLTFVGGEPTPPVTALGILGRWACP